MKRIISALLALVVSATLVVVGTSSKPGVTAVHAQGGCSAATLTGNYPFTYIGSNASGRSANGRNNVPNAAVGVFTLDGAGSFSVSYTVVVNGKARTTSVSDNGTYHVNSYCIGTLTDTTIEHIIQRATAGVV